MWQHGPSFLINYGGRMKKKKYYISQKRPKADPISFKFRRFIVKRYTFWTLLLHPNQYYLGRAILWLNRPGEMQRFSELSMREVLELLEAVKEYEEVLKALWKPNHMNYAWLGNYFHEHKGHGHMHLIPRYNEKRLFAERVYKDGRWGKNYAPYPKRKYSDIEILEIRDSLRSGFNE